MTPYPQPLENQPGRVPLILRSDDVGTLGGFGGPVVRAGTAVVYADAHGQIVGEQGRPVGAREKLAVRQRFVVDITDKQSVFRFDLPSRGDTFHFAAEVDVSWRVDRPWIVVARGIQDGHTLLQARLPHLMATISSGFEAEQANAAAAAINRRFGNRQGQLPEGVAIHSCFTKILVNQQKLAQKQELALKGDRLQAIKAAANGDPSFILAHLTENPGDTATVVNLVAQNRQVDVETRARMLQDLIKQGIIQDVDLEKMRAQLLGPLTELPGPSVPALEDGQNGAGPNGHSDGPTAPAYDAGPRQPDDSPQHNGYHDTYDDWDR